MLKTKKRYIILPLIIALSLICSNLLFATTNAVDIYDSMRLKWHDSLTGGSLVDMSDPDISNKVSQIAENAKSNWETMNTDASRTY